MNHVIIYLVFVQPFVDHLADIEHYKKTERYKNNLLIICEASTQRGGYQKAIYNPMNCQKVSKSSVKA